MRHQTYTRRRGETVAGFVSSRNTMRHTANRLGSTSYAIIIGLITLFFGLIYAAEGTKVTSYDYEISEVELNISEMTAKKEDLAVEKARLTSIATAKNSTVAAVMEDAAITGYATD